MPRAPHQRSKPCTPCKPKVRRGTSGGISGNPPSTHLITGSDPIHDARHDKHLQAAPRDGGRPRDTPARLNKTHADNLRAQFLVGNYPDAAGDLDPTAPHNLVSSPTDISNVVSSPVGDVNTQGWDGIAVDFDSIQSQAAQGLVNFV